MIETEDTILILIGSAEKLNDADKQSLTRLCQQHRFQLQIQYAAAAQQFLDFMCDAKPVAGMILLPTMVMLQQCAKQQWSESCRMLAQAGCSTVELYFANVFEYGDCRPIGAKAIVAGLGFGGFELAIKAIDRARVVS